MDRLEECKAVLVAADERETVQLIAMTILQLRMRLHHIGDAELKELCNAIEPEPSEQPGQWKALDGVAQFFQFGI
eukprot:gene57780-79167_t